jgi:predicted SAM-dependent methyltransferase
MEIKEFYERYWELVKYRNEFHFEKNILNVWDDEKNISKNDSFIILARKFNEYIMPSILDVGAGDRRFEKILELMNLNFEYSSLDISKEIRHDYTEMKYVNSKFDIVTMFELIEHLPLEVTLQYFTKSFEILNQKGILIISTPNAAHINQLWKQDVTHIHQYPAKDIYSILRMIGFSGEIETYRINLRPSFMSLKKRIIEKSRVIINKILEADYAHGVLIVAKKL